MLFFEPAQSIYRQGDPARQWYVVERGVARTFRVDGQGRRHLTGFHYPGDCFGVAVGTHRESCEAVTELGCSVVNAEADAASGIEAVQAIAAVSRAAERYASVHARSSAVERLAAFLVEAAERLGATAAFALPMSKRDVADYLGISPQTLGRSFLLLSEAGMARLEAAGFVQMPDRTALEALAQGRR